MATYKKSSREALTAWARHHRFTLLVAGALAFGPWWLAYFATVLRWAGVVSFWTAP